MNEFGFEDSPFIFEGVVKRYLIEMRLVKINRCVIIIAARVLFSEDGEGEFKAPKIAAGNDWSGFHVGFRQRGGRAGELCWYAEHSKLKRRIFPENFMIKILISNHLLNHCEKRRLEFCADLARWSHFSPVFGTRNDRNRDSTRRQNASCQFAAAW